MNEQVHVTHCCSMHGCKYGNEDCPVEYGRLNQEFPCEQCAWEDEVRTEPMSVVEAMQFLAEYVQDNELTEDQRVMIQEVVTKVLKELDDRTGL